jgi:hypothetical protein
VTNTLAYYTLVFITAVKSFIAQALGNINNELGPDIKPTDAHLKTVFMNLIYANKYSGACTIKLFTAIFFGFS